MSKTARITFLKQRLKVASAALAAYERAESELRSLARSDDPARFNELMRANAELINATRCSIGLDNDELDAMSRI